MLRRLLMAGLVLAAGTASAQFQQQRQDDLGVISTPPTGTAGVTGGPQTTPLQIPPTQSPVITNLVAPMQQQLQQFRRQQQQAQPAAKPAGEPAAAEPNEFQEFIAA